MRIRKEWMVLKAINDHMRKIKVYTEVGQKNFSGIPAWTPSDTTLLEQLAMTGTLSDSYHANAKDTAKEVVELLERVDAAELAAAIVKGRNEGFIRTFPILGLVYLSKKDVALFQETFCKVVLTGNDLVDFIEMAKTIRGLGRSVKKAIAVWIRKNTTPYYAQKYRKQIADAIRLVRFKGEDPIYAYILHAYSNVKGATAEKLEKAYAMYPVLAAHRDFKVAIEEGDLRKAEAILREKNVDVNSLTFLYGKFDKGLWAAVAARTPVTRFVKYLAKFIRENVLTEGLLRSKVNVEALKAAKVFPSLLFEADVVLGNMLHNIPNSPFAEYYNCPYVEYFPSDDGSNLLDSEGARAYLAEVIDDYAKTYDWSGFGEAKWVIAPSVSPDDRLVSSRLFIPRSLMFALFFAKGLKDVTLLPWCQKAREYTVSASESIMKQIAAIESEAVYVCKRNNALHMDSVVGYMLRNHVEADYVVFLPPCMAGCESDWLTAWVQYHRKYPKAVAFVVLRGDSYETSPIPEDVAAKLNVYQIFGWNDSVIDYMKFVIAKRKAA